jgi:hypothetical protein
MKGFKTIIAASVTLATLAGCSTSHTPSFQEARKKVESNTNKTFDEQIAAIKKERPDIGVIKRGFTYINPNDYSLDAGDDRRLPDNFYEDIYLKQKADNSPYSVDELAAVIFESHGVHLDTSSSDLRVLSGQSLGSSSGLEPQGVTGDSAGEYSNVVDLIGENDTSSSRDELLLKPFTYKGSLKDALDYVVMMNGLKWTYNPTFKKAYLYVNETREFFIHSFSSEQEKSTTITNSTKQDAESTQGGSQKEFKRSEKIEAWKNIEDTVLSMVDDENGETVSFDRKTGMIIATANDHSLAKIDSYIKKINETSMREINVTMSMVTFEYNEQDYKGLNINQLNTGLQNNLFGSFDVSAGLGSMSPDINGGLSAVQEIAGGNFMSLTNGPFNALMGFLNTVGTAEVGFDVAINVMNNENYTHQKVRNEEYISSIERQSFREGGGQDNVTTKKDVAVDGVNMTVRPRITGDLVTLEYDISISDFIDLISAGSSANLEGVKLKKDGAFNVNHIAKLRNGVPHVIQVIQEEEQSTESQGLLDDALWFLGGHERRKQNKSVILVTLTATFDN